MIEVKSLAKRFKLPKKRKIVPGTIDEREVDGWFEAVRDVSFHAASGEILGLLGPNGAGKTTSLRMLSTALAPTQGSVLVDGVDLVSDPLAARRKIGFLSGATALYGRLTVRENIRYFADVHGLSASDAAKRVDSLLKRLEMEQYADRRADSLSAGMKQRALIARSVVHAPRVLVLDEPTTGLDILGAQLVLSFMQECRKDGVAVVFSTHHLHEVETLCERVAVIDVGTSQFEGTVSSLRDAGQGDLARGYLSCLRSTRQGKGA
ncbi:ATP-binding cassette domain-containing protein [Burkholderiaceae bacterium DAT-1]|nr:ATP-binding cassette domain-containing protein [Burkholderiaceae bacterium DAT-1]